MVSMLRMLRLMVSMRCEGEKRKKFMKTKKHVHKRAVDVFHDNCARRAHGAFDVARERDANGREARTQKEKTRKMQS